MLNTKETYQAIFFLVSESSTDCFVESKQGFNDGMQIVLGMRGLFDNYIQNMEKSQIHISNH